MHPSIIEWCRNCASYYRPADISANNEDLWTVFLVLGILALVIWIVFAIVNRRA